MNFKNWMTKELTVKPSHSLDIKVLKQGSALLKEEKNYLTLSLSILTMAMFAVLILQTKHLSNVTTTETLASHSKEMILNYNEMELMADAGNLTDADWDYINRE